MQSLLMASVSQVIWKRRTFLLILRVMDQHWAEGVPAPGPGVGRCWVWWQFTPALSRFLSWRGGSHNNTILAVMAAWWTCPNHQHSTLSLHLTPAPHMLYECIFVSICCGRCPVWRRTRIIITEPAELRYRDSWSPGGAWADWALDIRASNEDRKDFTISMRRPLLGLERVFS